MSSRESLIESTRSLLWERGYVGTSPKAIQQRAGAGQGSMYHHFSGKEELALAAIERSAEVLREVADAQLSTEGTAYARIEAFLRRERDVLRGCPIGRLTQDPDVMATPALRAPVEETFAWLRGRLTAVLQDGLDHGEFPGTLDPSTTALAIVAVMQGGYVLARADDSPQRFEEAATGILGLLAAYRRPETE
ncbi:TetR family transcriptional regulator C-terminal domain-containing protein [Nocardia sp. NBC_00511]|uniref:TetR/AcrR family transcriptional regulator n=1 Tax=Nocardia sp. NBC_00511 TaxID=2903591 RepID=UPI0030DE812E